MMAPHTVFQILYLICAPGTQPDDCIVNSQMVHSRIDGPMCGSWAECTTMAYPFLGSLYAQGDPRIKDGELVKVAFLEVGEGQAPVAQYGKIGSPEFKKFD